MAPYEADEVGELRAVLPARCPFASPGEPGCELRVHHQRERTTGPAFKLDVVRCATHSSAAFTLYPPGHFPYGRNALLKCSVSGPLLHEPGRAKLPVSGTVLEAAEEAASGERWPAHSSGGPGTRRTQGRHLELAGLLLGAHPELDADVRAQIASRLLVPTMTLLAAASQWSSSWDERAAAVALVLAALPIDGSLPDRLLAAGYVAQLWPRPRRWQPPNHWVLARSAEPERRAKSRANSRSPPSSNSLGASPRPPAPPSPP